MDLAPEIRATIVSTVLNDKNAMFRICLVKLNNVVCNVEISGDYELWITKHPYQFNNTMTCLLTIHSHHSLCDLSMSVP
jgi:hypothetical protein